jgi:hypothetical protein
MDDVFKEWIETPPDPHYGDFAWLNPMLSAPHGGDRIGKWNSPPPTMYPVSGTSDWTWDMDKAYYINRDEYDPGSPAHFWQYTNQPDFQQAEFDLTPSDAWDNDLAPTTPPNFWYFLAYPLRCSKKIDVNNNGWSDILTLGALETDLDNPMLILKSDDGKKYIPGNTTGSVSLEYLEPGKGYFAGFQYPTTITCYGFAGEAEPAYVPGGGNKGNSNPENQISSVGTSHFCFKSRTHWWYPINIDTADLGNVTPEAGDEISVFDGDLCVGATAYPDSFPVALAAWMDDIATPDFWDGYIPGHTMTFKWFDASANAEITFTPPPGTQSLVLDPNHPTNSGFGAGFVALRSLTNGVQAVTQLPQQFRLGQNYPNPFNGETIIPLELPQRSSVKIELFNVQGRSLGLIFEGIKDAGWPKIRYNSSNLASGVYFCRVMAEGLEHSGKYQGVAKMLLLK